MKVEITVNGERTSADVEPRTLLAHYLRENVGLRATNIGCDTTSCGACTVLVDGESVKSCTVLAVQTDQQSVTTMEGLSEAQQLDHPVTAAFRQEHALQCGFCTPGMVMAAISLIDEARADHGGDLTESDVREGLEGNLCRCTGYHNIVRAVLVAAGQDPDAAQREGTEDKTVAPGFSAGKADR
ncbi:(2Fe-2S)-binding protein [Pseudonocardia ailaonensis]|uniref:(2Fe-2S)-binding protein n=1 Tax=Pseudonocardia ailaonensis TaxID=367279 RepID=A0ABN2NI39_9PSEU